MKLSQTKKEYQNGSSFICLHAATHVNRRSTSHQMLQRVQRASQTRKQIEAVSRRDALIRFYSQSNPTNNHLGRCN